MAKYKYIYWPKDQKPNGKGEHYANIHLLVGYNRASVADFREMAKELRETFPQASDDDILCRKAIQSRSFHGHSLIIWRAHIPKKDYPGWTQFEYGRQPEYAW